MYKSQRIIVLKRGHNMFGIVNLQFYNWDCKFVICDFQFLRNQTSKITIVNFWFSIFNLNKNQMDENHTDHIHRLARWI